MRMVASTSGRWRITILAVISDWLACAAMNSRAESGSMLAQTLSWSTQASLQPPVAISRTRATFCRVTRCRSLPMRMSDPQAYSVEVQQPVDGGVVRHTGPGDGRLPVFVQVAHQQQDGGTHGGRKHILALRILPGNRAAQVVADVVDSGGQHGFQLGVHHAVRVRVQPQVGFHSFKADDHFGTHGSLTAHGLGWPWKHTTRAPGGTPRPRQWAL